MKSNPRHRHPLFLSAVLLSSIFLAPLVTAQEAAPSAKELAGKMNAGMQDGSAMVRLKMEVRQGSSKSVYQIQVKSRRTSAGTDIVYQVLWPKDHKGESLLLRKPAGGSLSGTSFTLPDTLTPISSAKMKEAVFGGDLSYEDLVENFFAWPQQTIVGSETVDRAPCQILESKPGRNDHSSYSRVRSWIDVKRMVPMRIEKYSESGQVARRIDTKRVVEDDRDKRVPASLTVQRAGQGTITEIDGSSVRHDVSYTDADFTPEALRAAARTK